MSINTTTTRTKCRICGYKATVKRGDRARHILIDHPQDFVEMVILRMPPSITADMFDKLLELYD
jgi:transposase-like protein